MKPKVISWTVTQLHEVNKHMRIRNFLVSRKVDIVALQETKLEQISKNTMQSW
jgi:exonuclease III